GFDLARLAAARFPAEAGPGTVGMVLLNHGFFSFGETARESYERMIELVGRAEAYLELHAAVRVELAGASEAAPTPRIELASLRHQVSQAAGFPVILSSHTDAHSMGFVQRPD